MSAKRAKINPQTIAKMIRGDDFSLSMSELGKNFVQVVGGPAMLAQMLHDEYNKAKPGGMIRARILDMIIQVFKFININSPPPEDYGLVSDEDIDREIERNLLKVHPSDAEETEVPDSPSRRGQEEAGSGDAGDDAGGATAQGPPEPAASTAAAHALDRGRAGQPQEAPPREGQQKAGSPADVHADAGTAGVPHEPDAGTHYPGWQPEWEDNGSGS